MTDFRLFLPIEKIDVAKRLVYGTMTSQAVDKAGERFHYDSSKPHFERWSNDFKKATEHLGPEGQSLGNVRSMHKPKPAGKLVDLGFDDDNKKIDACAKVTDDDEWKNCLEGVLTGFSIGGSYVGDLWKDNSNPGVKWYTAAPIEVSLVDNPANPDARFKLIKADGSTEERSFVVPESMVAEPEVSWLRRVVERTLGKSVAMPRDEPTMTDPAKVACKAHGVVGCEKCAKAEKREFSGKEREHLAGTGAAMPGGGYPIENEQDLKNAIHAIGRAKDPAATRRHIISRAKALGHSDLIPPGWTAEKSTVLDSLAKGMQSVAVLADAFGDIRGAQRMLATESQGEGDSGDADLARRCGKLAKELAGIISDKSTHEGKEALTMTDIDDLVVQSFIGAMQKGADPMDLVKRFSAAHRGVIDKARMRNEKGVKSMRKGIKCLGKAMECMQRRVSKAAGAEDGDNDKEMAEHMKAAADHLGRSFRAHMKVKKSLTKAASGWVGQAEEGPARGEGEFFSGYKETKPTPPSTMQMGDIPPMSSTDPNTLLVNRSAPALVTKREADLMAENARITAERDILARMPAGGGSRPITFGAAPALAKGAEAAGTMLEDVDMAAIANGDASELSKVFGNIVRNPGKFAKSVGDPSFHGGALGDNVMKLSA